MIFGLFKVFIEDNSHYGVENERRELGAFTDFDEAVNACKTIVDDYLRENYKKGMTAEDLYTNYTLFGEDPFIISDLPSNGFSAWDYAAERCRQIYESEFEQDKISPVPQLKVEK